MTPSPWMATLLLVAFAVAVGDARAETDRPVLYRGHSGVWFDPARSGEGYVLEIISTDAATLTWFTYDDDGNQRWVFGGGNVVHSSTEGTYLDFPQLYDTSGGVFGEEFDPAQVDVKAVGSARIAFDDCTLGQFSYDAYGASASVSIRRLASTMGLGCAPAHGLPGAKVGAHAGESGTWFDPSHNGEGFQLQWSGDDQALLTWYSYDAEGRQYWMTGVGAREDGNRIVFPSLLSTRGARFGAGFDPDDVERFDWGSLTLELDCGAAQATYSSDIPGFAPGAQSLRKLTGLLGVSCPWTPSGLTGIHDVQIAQIPTVLPSDGLPVQVRVQSIADDGTVLAAKVSDGRIQVHRLAPGAATWEALTDDNLAFGPVQISADASRILANEAPESGVAYSPLLWESPAGWNPITGTVLAESRASAGSRQLTYLVGHGRPTGDVRIYPWKWSEELGQVELPRTEEIRLAYPLAVAEDGSIVVGAAVEPTSGGFPIEYGIRWQGDDDPEYLHDAGQVRLRAATACSADCRVVFGAGQAIAATGHAFENQPWMRLDSGDVVYLGHVAAALADPAGSFYSLSAVTSDGSMVVGGHSASGVPGDAPFLWSRLTGPISLRDLAVGLDDTLGDWEDIHAVDVSSDGSLVLLLAREQGARNVGAPDSPDIWRAAVLRLRPLQVGETPPAATR